MIRYYDRAGFDFIVLTDHNRITDPVTSDRAGAALIRVLGPTETLADAAGANDTLGELPSDDPVDAALRQAGTEGAVAHRHAWGELDLYPLPAVSQGAVQQGVRLHQDRSPLRWIAALLILMCGVAGAVLLTRRGLDAAAQDLEGQDTGQDGGDEGSDGLGAIVTEGVVRVPRAATHVHAVVEDAPRDDVHERVRRLGEDELASLVSRDSMIGVARAREPDRG